MKDNTQSIRDRVTNALFKKKLLVKADLDKALEIQKQKGGKLSDILVGMGLVSRNDIVSILSEELSIPRIDLARYKISPETIKLIPKKIAKSNAEEVYSVLSYRKTKYHS